MVTLPSGVGTSTLPPNTAFVWANGHLTGQVLPIKLEQAMGGELHHQVDIRLLFAVRVNLTLTLEPDFTTFSCLAPGWNAYFHLTVTNTKPAFECHGRLR